MKNSKITKYHLISFIIPFIISFTAIVIGGFAPFGTHDVLSSSGNEEIATYLYKLYDYLHGNYKSNDINAIWSFFLTDPTNLIIMLAPPQLILTYVNFLYILKLSFSGVTFYIFLANRNYSNDTNSKNESVLVRQLLNISLSSAYALSGFMLGKGMNITILSSVVLLPLIILYLEKIVIDEKWNCYYIILTISFITNVYMTILISVFTLLYFFTLKYKDVKHFIKSFCIKTFADILSIGSSAFVIIPSFRGSKQLGILYSEVPISMNITSFWDVTRRLFFLSEPSSYTNTAYGIDIYSGLFSIIILIIYTVSPKIDIYTKIRRLSLIALLFVSTNIIGLNSVFNAFMTDHLNFCNFTFEFILLILLLCHEAIYTLKDLKLIHLIIPFAFIVTSIILSMLFANTYLSIRPFIVSLELVFVYSILILLYILKINKKNIIFYIFSAIIFLELSISYITGFALISKKDLKYLETYSCSKYLAEQTIILKNPDARIISYDIYDDYFNPVFNSINGINYVIVPANSDNPDACLEYYNSIGNADIYYNSCSINNPLYANSDIINWTYSDTSPYKSAETLLSYITENDENLFSKTDATFDSYTQLILDDAGNPNSERHDQTFGYTPTDAGHLYSCFFRPVYLGNSQNDNTLIKTYDVTSKYSVFDKQIYYLYNLDLDTYNNEIAKLNNNPNNNTIDIKNDGFLINNVGKVSNNIYVIDDKAIQPICIDDSLWITPISQGHHLITKSSVSWFSFIALLLSITFCCFSALLIRDSKQEKQVLSILKKNKASSIIFNFVKNNYVYVVTIVVSAVILIISCLLKSCIPFGNESILTSDGYAQTYPNMQGIASSFKLSLETFKLSTISFGTMIFSSGYDPIASYLSIILQLIFKLFIKTSDGRMYGAMVAGIYYILSGPSMIFYLTHKYSGKRYTKNDSRLIPLGLFYNLSAYIIGFYTFSCFQYGIYVPFIVLALERLIYKNKPYIYILMLAYIILRGYYTALLLCEFLILYFLIQDFNNFKDFFTKGLRFAFSSILAACLAITTLLPAFNFVQGSRYAETDAEKAANSSITITSSIFKTFSQYQPGHIGLVSNTDNQIVNIYIGLIPLLFLGAYFANKNITILSRIKRALVFIVMYYAFGNPVLNYVFHGFHFQSNVPNRFAIFFTFLLLSTFADLLTQIDSFSYKRLLLPPTIIGILSTVVWIIYPERQLQSTIFALIMTTFYICFLVYSYIKKSNKSQIINKLLFISLVELIIGSIITFQSCIGYSNRIIENNNKSIQTMINKEKQSLTTNDIFIAENLTSSYDNLNMGKINGYSTMSGFSSGLGSSIYNMTQTWGIFATANIIKYGTGNPLADMMLHVKYQFVDTDDDEYNNASIYNKIDTENNMILYENPYYLPLSFMTDSNLKEWSETNKYDYDNIVDCQNAFSQAVCGKDLYTIIGTTNKDTKTSYSGVEIDTLMGDSNTYGTNDMNVHLDVSKDITGKIYSLSETEIVYIGDTSNSKTFDYTIYNYTRSELGEIVPIYIAVLNEEVLSEMHSMFNKNICTDLNRTKTSIYYNIDADNNKTMYISIPNNSNLEIWVDGKKTARYEYLAGIGVDLTEGHHEIEIKCPYNLLNIGNIITIISLLIIIFSFIYNKYKHKNKQCDTTDSTT